MMESSVGLALPWKTRISVSLLSLVTDSCRRTNGSINRRLLRLFDFRCAAGPGISDHTIDPSRNLWFRLYVPQNQKNNHLIPLILFFHGGGFAFLSPDSLVYDAVCRKLATLIPAVVVSVNYRLSPEHTHPCQYEDGFDALNFIANNAPPTADLSRCFLCGDSAGANLAHHVAVRVCRDEKIKLKVAVVGLISIQPFFGGEERTESETRLRDAPIVNLERTDWMWKAFLPNASNRDHPSCNVSGPNADHISSLSHYPKTLVVVGGLDPLQDWQRRYFDWLRRSNKDATLLHYPNAIHAFYIFPELPQSQHLLLQLKHFVASASLSLSSKSN